MAFALWFTSPLHLLVRVALGAALYGALLLGSRVLSLEDLRVAIRT